MITRPCSVVLSLSLVLSLSCCRPAQPNTYTFQKSAFSSEGMIVSAHPLATQTGLDILNAGGNAVDAAIAIQLALAVVYPRAGNIGGGGFMIYRSADGDIAALDFREKAPKAAQRDLYLDEQGNVIPELSTRGHLASGVPGTIAGLVAAYEKYGSLPWKKLCENAIRYARNGHPITQFEARRLNALREMLIKYNGDQIPFIADSIWKEDDRLTQPELAQTLERIAESGNAGFYSGKTAELIVDEMKEGLTTGKNGIITLDDLAAYKAIWREPISTDYQRYRIISMPPPSSGGIALIQLLEIAEQHPLKEWGPRDLRSIHLMVEAERRIYADRAKHLGDSDFYPVPVDTLLDAQYLNERMSDFHTDRATVSADIAAGKFSVALESFETTHFTVVDRQGNAVAITTTLNDSYGCKVIVDGAGFFLNNEMDDFSVKPGTPNIYGLIGGDANAIMPEKRMLSSMAPTIVEKDGEFFMTIGTPGGSTIITSVFQVFLNVVEFEMSASSAVSALRFHHQWLPDEIMYEQGCFDDSLKTSLIVKGHNLKEVNGIGLVEVILRLPDGTYEGAADPREGSHAEGIK